MRGLDWKRWFPWTLAVGRAGLGPVLIAGAACGWNGLALAGIVLGALLSDIYDGVLARRWHTDTAALRLSDSMADTVFYLCTAAAIWIAVPGVWRENGWLLVTLLALETARVGFELVKFGRPASYHSWLAKAWGLVLALAVMLLFARGCGNVLIPAALLMGVLCNGEGLAMSLLLPEWRRDVRSLGEARRLAQQARKVKAANLRLARVGGTGLLLLCLWPAVPASAADKYQVIYLGGTMSWEPGSVGTLDPTTASALRVPGASRGGELEIPYAEACFEYHSEVAHHLGVLPAVLVGLVRKRERRHLITIQYRDVAGSSQVAVLEVPKQAPQTLLPVLQAKIGRRCVAAGAIR